MEYVQPIKDRQKLQEIKEVLKKNGSRDYMLFELGINTGLRISDLRNLKVSDIMNSNQTPKEHIKIVEEKTKKTKIFKLNLTIQNELLLYCKNMKSNEYLFQSRKGVNVPISRVQAYRIIKEAGEKVGISNLGSHSIRKTMGYFFYTETKDIAMLQKLFNHSSPSITLRYIGIEQEEIDTALQEFLI